MKTGTTDLPLHYGRAPRWLFSRMCRLASEITQLIVLEYGPAGFLARLSDPFWFQAVGCVLGFDWHSSGLTTTTCGAIKTGIKDQQEELGLFVAGGKGATSRRTPEEIAGWGEKTGIDATTLIHASRTAAKVDSAAVQDGYQIYHHVFFFDRTEHWAVIQQGMNEKTKMARRYHWFSTKVDDFVCEPHAAICCDARGSTLNLVAEASDATRQRSTALSRSAPQKLVDELMHLKSLALPRRHELILEDIHPQRLERIFLKTYEAQPTGFEALLTLPGVGAKTLRALSLIAELVYGSPPSYDDPARYSFAHGGKDGIPYPVDRETYDCSIALLERAIRRARFNRTDAIRAFRRLEHAFGNPSGQGGA
jgi:hypothetical protein